MARVQNIDAIRDNDILDANNMSKTERMELLSINFYETLFKRLSAGVGAGAQDFEHQPTSQAQDEDQDQAPDEDEDLPKPKVKVKKAEASGTLVATKTEPLPGLKCLKHTRCTVTERVPPCILRVTKTNWQTNSNKLLGNKLKRGCSQNARFADGWQNRPRSGEFRPQSVLLQPQSVKIRPQTHQHFGPGLALEG